MAQAFNIDRLYGNISKLMKDQGIKVSEIETVMGVSTGYYSKLSKNQTVPNADVLYRIAQRLGVTVDMLITCDLTSNRATDNLRLMIAFIQKVRKLTDSVDLRWEKHTLADLEFEYVVLGDEKDPTIVRSFKKKDSEEDETLFYRNGFSKTRIDFVGECYRTKMPGYTLYINKLAENAPEGEHSGESVTYYELSAAYSGNTECICNGKEAPEINAELELLYVCLQKHAADLQMSESVRDLITNFIGPADDDGLPF